MTNDVVTDNEESGKAKMTVNANPSGTATLVKMMVGGE